MTAAANIVAEPCVRAFEQHFHQVAQDCWDVEDNGVVLLNANGDRERNLRSQLQALGLDVFIGANDANAGPAPVIGIEVEAWHWAKVREQVEDLRANVPDAAICVVTGFLEPGLNAHASNYPVFDDARAFLQKAGFRFFSFGGVGNDDTVYC